MKFGYVFRNSITHTFTIGICEIMFLVGETGITWRQYKWRLQSLLSLWRLGTLLEKSEEKLEESRGTVRDAAISVGWHVSLLRGKGWVIHNWGLVRTCVGILRGLNWSFILGCLLNCNFSFMILNKLLMFWLELLDKLCSSYLYISTYDFEQLCNIIWGVLVPRLW